MRAMILLLACLAMGCGDRARTRNSASAELTDEPTEPGASSRVYRYETTAQAERPRPIEPPEPEKARVRAGPKRPEPPAPPARSAVVTERSPRTETAPSRKEDVLEPAPASAPVASAPAAKTEPPPPEPLPASLEPPPTPASRAGFKTVGAAELESYRTSGRRIPDLPAAAAVSAQRDHLRAVTVGVALCVAPDGRPASVELTAPSGNRDADASVLSEIERWRFRPYFIGGRSIRVCTRLSFSYQVG